MMKRDAMGWELMLYGVVWCGLFPPLFCSALRTQVELEEIAGHCKDDPMRVTWIGHATILVQVNMLVQI